MSPYPLYFIFDYYILLNMIRKKKYKKKQVSLTLQRFNDPCSFNGKLLFPRKTGLDEPRGRSSGIRNSRGRRCGCVRAWASSRHVLGAVRAKPTAPSHGICGLHRPRAACVQCGDTTPLNHAVCSHFRFILHVKAYQIITMTFT